MDEFITAFGRYKRVMCLKFPDRREELDIYEAHMNELYRHFGPTFYSYHKMFAAKAETALLIDGVIVDWSKYDSALLTLLLESNASSNQNGQGLDKRGCQRKTHNGAEVCNDFNVDRCFRQSCSFSHVCKKCFSDQHSARNCQKSVQGNNRRTIPNRASSQYKPVVPENANRSNNSKS
ncbi:hypothetical protein KUTeg_004684 [Tegillarca granosa]|uniref:C3H1-type domain-containing protein n=1 Tax=Tegillarca granosa TaxID=220873 RepID=A0ABQ9FKH1_TEGGR|nr:hypothetical protein KUTeg_004684 [Tegillarca granosa]